MNNAPLAGCMACAQCAHVHHVHCATSSMCAMHHVPGASAPCTWYIFTMSFAACASLIWCTCKHGHLLHVDDPQCYRCTIHIGRSPCAHEDHAHDAHENSWQPNPWMSMDFLLTGKVHSNIGGRGDPSANCEFKANSFKRCIPG